jgi:AraC-like DNA-binding protein
MPLKNGMELRPPAIESSSKKQYNPILDVYSILLRCLARQCTRAPARMSDDQPLIDNNNFRWLRSRIIEGYLAALDKAYMEQARVSITEMSFLLGFADTSSFTRAFRRWTGKSPRDYRRNLGMEH